MRSGPYGTAGWAGWDPETAAWSDGIRPYNPPRVPDM